MKIKFDDIGPLFKETYKRWFAKDPFRQSATIAYYAIFSLPALLIIVITTAGLIFEKEAVSGQIYDEVKRVMGADTAQQVEAIVIKASKSPKTIWAGVLGIITLLFGATGVFVELQKSLNMIWGVKAKPAKTGKGIWLFLRSRLFSFGLILTIGFLLLTSLVLDTVLSAFSGYVKTIWSTGTMVVFHAIDLLVSFSLITVLFALMFQFLPDVKIRWKYIWTGSMLTAALFTLGRYGLGLYFGKVQPESTYGAAGSVVLILLWVSYSSMILFFGAEFTRAMTLRYRGPIQLGKHVVKIDDHK